MSSLPKIKPQILEESASRFVYRLDYKPVTVTVALMASLFFAGIIYGSILFFLSGESPPWGVKLLLGLLAPIPPGVFIGVAQVLGFREIWIVDHAKKIIGIKIYRLLGETYLEYPSTVIKKVNLLTDPDEDMPEERYQVQLVAEPPCNLRGSGQKHHRILHTTDSLEAAKHLADTLRHYLDL